MVVEAATSAKDRPADQGLRLPAEKDGAELNEGKIMTPAYAELGDGGESVALALAELGDGVDMAAEDDDDGSESSRGAMGFGLGLLAHNFLYRHLKWSQADSRSDPDACRWDRSAICSTISGN
jgi:hypothetical protein